MYEQTPKRQNIKLTPQRTPISQQRSYLSFNQNQKRQQVNAYHQSQTPHMIQEIFQQQQEQNQKVIWGTNISTNIVMKQLKNFLLTYQQHNDDNNQGQKIYYEKFRDYDLDLFQNLFEIDGRHLKQWDSELYYQLIYYPAEIIVIFDKVIRQIYQQQFIDNIDIIDRNIKEYKQKKKNTLMFSIKHLNQISLMRGLNEKHINRLVSFRGIVIRSSDIYPEMNTAMFQCLKCKAQVFVTLFNAKVQQPKSCENCKYKDTFSLIHKFCGFTDKQYIKLQQLPEFVPEGQTPTSMSVVCYQSNVNEMKPGDRVEIVGLYRCQAKKVNRNKNSLLSVFQTFTDLISYRVMQQNRFRASTSNQKSLFNDEDKQMFHVIASSQNVIQDLVESFAQSISGYQTIKKGLLAQIFGGSQKVFEGRGRFRSDINICLVGDPSTAKSQMLKQVHSIAPRGIYTSGKGSSAVGLTANVRKDPQTKEFVLESGALVLSDLGICCIDQFDKMDQDSKLILLQAMQQQTISVAKAGIVCQLNSRASILSAANPLQSKYDTKKSVIQNINLPPALLSRFDLIYIILDVHSQKLDRKLAQHILSIYSGKDKTKKEKEAKIPRSLLVKYITFAKQYITPKITESAAKRLTQCYLEMRKTGNSSKTVSATPRQLESLIRISEAFAKMKLRSYVQENDVNLAYELIREALHQSATDPQTGMIDMDVIVTGQTSASRKRVQTVVALLIQYFQSNLTEVANKKMSFDKVQLIVFQNWKASECKPTPDEIREALLKLEKKGYIIIFGADRSRPIIKFLRQDGKD